MSVRIFIDDLEVGSAETVEVDAQSDRLSLLGLDRPATMFFSALVGPGDPAASVPGPLAISDEAGKTRLMVLGANVVDHSTGGHRVVLTAAALRR